jgi:16S rRNA processing protein RimM
VSSVRIGRLGRTHGVQGELNLDGTSLTPLELHAIKRFVWRRAGAAERVLTLVAARPALRRMLVRFEGVTVCEEAALLTNGELWTAREALPDPGPGTAYTFQLVGLRVETEEGRVLGAIAEVISTGAHPVYAVRGARELLVPGAPGVVKRVDLEAGLMVVALPAGLEEL